MMIRRPVGNVVTVESACRAEPSVEKIDIIADELP